MAMPNEIVRLSEVLADYLRSRLPPSVEPILILAVPDGRGGSDISVEAHIEPADLVALLRETADNIDGKEPTIWRDK